MAAFTNQLALLTQSSAIATNLTGATLTLLGSEDDVPGSAQTFKVWFEATLSNGNAPTWDGVVETSPDGVKWVTVASATQRTAAGAYAEIKDATLVSVKVRARITVGGTAAPDWTGTVRLLSDGGFRLLG